MELVRHAPATCRDSRPGDASAIAGIYGHAVIHGLATFELEPPPESEIARRVAATVAAGFPHLVAERDGAVLGYAYAGPFRSRPGYRFTVEDSIYIAPAAQRQGVGRLLLAALIARCAADGFRRMIAVIGDAGNAASVGLHRACGFEPAGLVPGTGWKFDRWRDCLILSRPLGVGTDLPPGDGAPRLP